MEQSLDTEELSNNVEQLVDHISNLVLSTVTGDMSQINISCEGIAKYTDKVVVLAKDIAIATRNKEIQIEITHNINGIATSIQDLVVAFTTLITNRNDKDKKRQFATAAKNVGTAINQLIVSIDLMSCRRLLPEIEVAKELQVLLLKSYTLPLDSLVEVIRDFGQQSVNIVQIGSIACCSTADRTKSSLLKHALNDYKHSAAQLLHTTKRINQDLNNLELKNDLASQYKNVLRIYGDIIDAANIIPDFSSKFEDAFDRFNKMLDFANAVRYATQAVIDGIAQRIGDDEFATLARAALQTTKSLLDQAMQALENETDPTRRAQILQAIQQLKDAGAQFIKHAQAAQQDPSNPQKMQDLKSSQSHLDEAVDKLVTLTTASGLEEKKLLYTAKFLEELMDSLMKQHVSLTPDQILEQASVISSATDRFNKDARAVAAIVPQESMRENILNNIVDMRKIGDRYQNDIRNLSRSRGSPSHNEMIDRAKKSNQLKKAQISKTLVACGLKDDSPDHHHHHHLDNNANHDGNDLDELVLAAKEQAKYALILANDAEKMAQHSMMDPAKKNILLQAIHILRENANDVIYKAKLASADPHNLDKQIDLDESQRSLVDNINKVITLTSLEANEEIQNLLRTMSQFDDSLLVVENIFSLAEKLMRDIERFMSKCDNEDVDPQAVVMEAKEISTLTNQLSSLIRKMADSVDPKDKEQFIAYSRFVRDRATQVKMIAAVKAASGGAGTGQLTSSADGLKSTIGDCVNYLKANELQRRRRATTQRAQHIRELVALWQKMKK